MRLTEPAIVADVFASGLGRIDILNGGFARFVMYVERPREDGSTEYRVVAKFVMPLSAIPDAILQTTKATAISTMGFAEPAYN